VQRLNGDERKRQIVEACARAIANEGFSAASVRVIAQHAGVSVGTLQHHFGGKDEIVLACLEHVWNVWLAGASRILTRTEPALHRLEHLISWTLGDPQIDYLWRVAVAFAHETMYEPRLAMASADASRRWSDLVSATVEEALREGDLVADSEELTCELTTVMNGALLGLHSNPPRLTRHQAIAICERVLEARSSDWLTNRESSQTP
jgi:AcrR family transcriptional regulator